MKYFKILIIFCLVVLSFGCVNTNPPDDGLVALPKLDGLSRKEISEKLDKLGLEYTFICEPDIYTSEEELDKFVKYGRGYKTYQRVEKGTHLYIYTTALPIPSEAIVDVQMDFDYYGKTFLEDGVEVVTLARAIDGDTAHFYTQDGTYIKVRFLGIDTPESTMEKEAWGKAAASFTAEILNNAETIVIEAEGNIQDTYGRYLAFVWADGVLVNLEVVRNAYSNAKLSSKSKYYDAFYETEVEAMMTGRHVWGEIDPNYDYEKEEFK